MTCDDDVATGIESYSDRPVVGLRAEVMLGDPGLLNSGKSKTGR